MLTTVLKKVNTRTESNTASPKVLALGTGVSININRIEFGESYRGNNIWLVDDKQNKYWSGAFNFLGFDNTISKSTQFRDFPIVDLWKVTTGENVKIGIIDCGINISHKSLKHTKVTVLNEGDASCMHGTYMASIISGTDIEDGYVGVAPNAEIVFYGYGDIEELSPLKLMAILKQMEHVDIINMSFAIRKPIFFPRGKDGKDLNDFIQSTILQNNKIIIASCGNDSTQTGFAFYPAAYDQIISISALKSGDHTKLEEGANFWQNVTMAGIWDSFFDLANTLQSDFEGLNDFSGTSPAAAFISGVFGLLKSNANKQSLSLTSKDLIDKSCSSVSLASSQANQTYTTHVLDKQKLLSSIKS